METLVKYVIEYNGKTYQGTSAELANAINVSRKEIYMAKRNYGLGFKDYHGIKIIDSFPRRSIIVTDPEGKTHKYSSFVEAGRGTGYSASMIAVKAKFDYGMKDWKIEMIENIKEGNYEQN